ncbi:MAG: ATP-binding protein [Victivallales bacterium]|nr:ATP-binding protein [Victivallales bacterium]
MHRWKKKTVASMKDLTTSIYDFEDLIQGNFLYVDKTEYIWRLLRPAKGMYFLSRPRRFGKSLLVSTLKAIFEGKKELFQGLAIHDKPYGWGVHPVIHLDMNGRDFSTVEKMEERLKRILLEQAGHNGVKLQDAAPDTMFHELIRVLYERKGEVVLLLDEYDKPILGNISKENCSDFLASLKAFYSVIKEKAKMLRFALVTGVSKFCHMSLFSDLNNLTDITLASDYAGMLGFTEEEVRRYFADRIPAAASANGVSESELMVNLRGWYDGYRFSEADIHVCNPVSVTNFFHNKYKFSNYWDSTGTPSFLLGLMRRQSYSLEAALNGTYDESVFAAYELDRLDVTGLLWQTGYLTIRELVPGLRRMKYRLGFPDYEVEDTFMTRLLEHFCDIPQGTGEDTIEGFQKAIANDDLDGFMTMLQSFLANIPYGLHLKHEKYYQTVFFIFFRLLGLFIEAESCTNQGRIDAYVRTEKTVFIFEFKLDKSPDEAVGQILDRHYYEKFQGGGLPIRLVGVNFDSSKGRIDGWQEGTLASVK